MSDDKVMENVPQPLIDDIAAGKCLPFIGAGFSLNARLPKGLRMPAWRELTQILARTARVSPDNGGPSVASTYERKFGRVQLIEAIRNALHVDSASPGDAHKKFAELPFDTVYTTNFDLLLENAYNTARKPFRSLVGELQMPFHGGPLTTSIIKMHGDLRHEEHIVVTQADYKKYLRAYPVVATHLSAMLITRTALFIGYSLSDPDFRHIREVVRSRLGRFERMCYLIEFDTTPEDSESMLSDNMHVISIRADPSRSKDAMLADLFEAIQKRLDAQEGADLRVARPEMFEQVREETIRATSQAVDASSLLTSSSNLCFVMMAFGPELDHIYRELVKPAVEQFGLSVLRADEIYAPGSITGQIRSAIKQARLCVADVSGKNPNVLYEVGIAHTLGKPTVLITRQIDDVPFDLRSIRFIVYDPNSIETARVALEHFIRNVLGEGRLEEARRLIENGMYRAAVAMLGVLLEHSLRELGIKYTDTSSARFGKRPLGLGQAVRSLTDLGIVKKEDGTRLMECIVIRNRAVHELEEPNAEAAKMMFNQVREFIERYLGPGFLKETQSDT